MLQRFRRIDREHRARQTTLVQGFRSRCPRSERSGCHLGSDREALRGAVHRELCPPPANAGSTLGRRARKDAAVRQLRTRSDPAAPPPPAPQRSIGVRVHPVLRALRGAARSDRAAGQVHAERAPVPAEPAHPGRRGDLDRSPQKVANTSRPRRSKAEPPAQRSLAENPSASEARAARHRNPSERVLLGPIAQRSLGPRQTASSQYSEFVDHRPHRSGPSPGTDSTLTLGRGRNSANRFTRSEAKCASAQLSRILVLLQRFRDLARALIGPDPPAPASYDGLSR